MVKKEINTIFRIISFASANRREPFEKILKPQSHGGKVLKKFFMLSELAGVL